MINYWYITLVPFVFTGLSGEGVFILNQILSSLCRTALETHFAWRRDPLQWEILFCFGFFCHWQCNIKDCERQNKLAFRI